MKRTRGLSLIVPTLTLLIAEACGLVCAQSGPSVTEPVVPPPAAGPTSATQTPQESAPRSLAPTITAVRPPSRAIPVEDWLKEPENNLFRWTVRVGPAQLSPYQRLLVRIQIQVDGEELVKRRGKGPFLMAVRVRDSQGKLEDNYDAINLNSIDERAAKTDIQFTQDVFVLPGDYTIGMVIYVPQTEEHSAKQRPLHVNPLRTDPLPEAWKGLPTIEVLRTGPAQAGLILPRLAGRLNLPIASKTPVELSLLMNASPSAIGPAMRKRQLSSRSAQDLLAPLRVLSQLHLDRGTSKVKVVDLTRQKVLFDQRIGTGPGGFGLSWGRLRTALGEADPNRIDVRALANQDQNAQFFVAQVAQDIGQPLPRFFAQSDDAKSSELQTRPPVATPSPGPAETKPESPRDPDAKRVMVILSGPMSFESGEDTKPIQLEGQPQARIYYIRYHSFVPTSVATINEPRRGRVMAMRPIALEPIDQLAGLLKPLRPRVFDVYSPNEFRKALAAIMAEVAKL